MTEIKVDKCVSKTTLATNHSTGSLPFVERTLFVGSHTMQMQTESARLELEEGYVLLAVPRIIQAIFNGLRALPGYVYCECHMYSSIKCQTPRPYFKPFS